MWFYNSQLLEKGWKKCTKLSLSHTLKSNRTGIYELVGHVEMAPGSFPFIAHYMEPHSRDF